MDYGTDFLLVDGDIVFTADGDVELVSGVKCIAQDIGQTLEITVGTLAWDKKIGSSLPLMLNDDSINNQAIIAELERVAIDDPRVDPGSVHAEEVPEEGYRLEFTPLGMMEPQTLDYDLLKGKG
jgi:hypothetical protein